ITGSVARTEGGSYAATLKIVSARDASPLSLAKGRFKNEEALLDWLTEQAPRMATEVGHILRAGQNLPPPAAETPTPAVSTAPSAPIRKGWFGIGAGAAVAIAGGVVYGIARADAAKVSSGSTSIGNEMEPSAAVPRGQAEE